MRIPLEHTLSAAKPLVVAHPMYYHEIYCFAPMPRNKTAVVEGEWLPDDGFDSDVGLDPATECRIVEGIASRVDLDLSE
jgi:hypothetical protein